MSEIGRGLKLGELGQHIGSTLIRQTLGVVVALVLSILLARALGPEGNGFYNLALLAPLVAAKLFDLGVPSANAYFLGRKRVSPHSAWRTTLRLWAVLSAAALLASLAFAFLGGKQIFPGVPLRYLLLAIVMLPPLLGHNFAVSLLQGVQDFRAYNWVLLAGSLITLLLALVLVVWLDLGVSGAIMATLLGYISRLLLSRRALATHIQRAPEADETEGYARSTLSYGWKTQLSTIASFLNYRVDIYLVNFLIGPAAAGVYVIAVQLGERLWILSQSVGVVLLPRLSELNADEESRLRLTPLVARWVFLMSLGGALLLAMLGWPIISKIYGAAYDQAYTALLWLLPGIVLISGARVLANDIAARGRPELNTVTAWMVLSVNLVANLLLIPRLGLVGAAIASTVAYTLNAMAKMWQYARISGNPWWKPLRPTPDDWRLVRQGVGKMRAMALR